MKNRLITITLSVLLPIILFGGNKPKYVFYFIGDGMGFNHVSLAELYKGYNQGVWGPLPLSFSQFPVLGISTTYSASNLITDSAAGGTALATGEKTTNGVIAMEPDCSEPLNSIAYKIHDAGYRVGITSTVGINHATPASFYAHNCSRSNYYEIAKEMGESGFEFYGGGGIISHNGNNKGQMSIYELLPQQGYTVVEGIENFDSANGAEKVFLTHNYGWEVNTLKYAIDQNENDMTHADIVAAAIEFLYRENSKGFFLLSEGGKIDWSSHSNDAKTTALEVLDLSDAISIALEFYNRFPDETLIVVTADHETGGLALGKGNGYNIYLNELDFQECSKDFVTKKGIKAIDKATEKAHIGWTTVDHSGANVPVFAIGASSELFSGRMNNIEIPERICKAMEIEY